MFASHSLVGIRLVYKKSVRAVLVAHPAFRGLRIARLVGRTNLQKPHADFCIHLSLALSRQQIRYANPHRHLLFVAIPD